MAAPTKLAEKQLENALRALPGWELRDGKLHRDFKFADFSAAFAFMTRVALAGESRNDHPEGADARLGVCDCLEPGARGCVHPRVGRNHRARRRARAGDQRAGGLSSAAIA